LRRNSITSTSFHFISSRDARDAVLRFFEVAS
jgi:hypothetical protein